MSAVQHKSDKKQTTYSTNTTSMLTNIKLT